ncbi:iron chaperone [Pedobacter ginsengisoli]|uniref:iron chaperone n=1 Tax=Pedobacter ginsengisoli TaxID=363852 RepID=UPI002550FDDA|nr:DUF1801 domain-containing protein [Pedobacter ginsengisoli]
MAEREKFETIDGYIGTFPENVQLILQEIRKVMKENAPDAEELISYQIPAFRYYGMLIYYSAYQKHVSVSTAPFKVFEVFEKELSPYKRSKSTVQFPLDQPVPYQLIAEMTKFRVKENKEIAEAKATKKKK